MHLSLSFNPNPNPNWKVEERIAQLMAEKAAKKKAAESEMRTRQAEDAEEEMKSVAAKEAALKAEKTRKDALEKKKRMDELEIQRQLEEKAKEEQRRQVAAAKVRAIQVQEEKERAALAEKKRQEERAREEAARVVAHKAEMERRREEEEALERRRQKEEMLRQREELERKEKVEAEARKAEMASMRVAERKAARKAMLAAFRERSASSFWGAESKLRSLSGSLGGSRIAGSRMEAPAVDVAGAVAAVIYERNPTLPGLGFKFKVAGKEPKGVQDAVHWVSARLMQGQAALLPPDGPAQPLCNYTVKIGKKELQIVGVRVTTGNDGIETPGVDYLRCQGLIFVSDDWEANPDQERQSLLSVIDALPEAFAVPLLVISVAPVFTDSIPREALETAALEAGKSALKASLGLSELDSDKISSVEVLPLLRTEGGEEVAPIMGGLSAGLAWLADQSPPIPHVERTSTIHNCLAERLDAAWSLETHAGPSDYIHLYNDVVAQVASLSVSSIQRLPWPPLEFALTGYQAQCRSITGGALPLDWNDSARLVSIKASLGAALLPQWHGENPTREDGVMRLCLEYASIAEGTPQSLAMEEAVSACMAEFKGTHQHSSTIKEGDGAYWCHFIFRLIQARLWKLRQETDSLGVCYLSRREMLVPKLSVTGLTQKCIQGPEAPKAVCWYKEEEVEENEFSQVRAIEGDSLSLTTVVAVSDTPEKRRRVETERRSLALLPRLSDDPLAARARALETSMRREISVLNVSERYSNVHTENTVPSDMHVVGQKRTLEELLAIGERELLRAAAAKPGRPGAHKRR